MIGAINFLRDWVGICQKSKCSNCRLLQHGVCTNQLEKFNNERINKAINVVIALKLQEKEERKNCLPEQSKQH